MKTAVLAALLLSVTFSPVQAEDGKLIQAGKRAGFYAKKAVLLLPYMVVGAGAGAVIWCHFGGREKQLKQEIDTVLAIKALIP